MKVIRYQYKHGYIVMNNKTKNSACKENFNLHEYILTRGSFDSIHIHCTVIQYFILSVNRTRKWKKMYQQDNDSNLKWLNIAWVGVFFQSDMWIEHWCFSHNKSQGTYDLHFVNWFHMINDTSILHKIKWTNFLKSIIIKHSFCNITI